MKSKTLFKLIFFIFLLTTINAQDTSKKKEESLSDYDEKLSVIKYGLGDDILELIKQLQNDEDTRFDSDLQTLFSETKIPAVREALFSHFAFNKNEILKPDALMILENRYDYPKDTVRAAIFYIKEIKITEASENLKTMLKEDAQDFDEASIAAFAKIGTPEDAVFLSEFFENATFEDEKHTLIIKQNIMFALEELHYSENRDFFKRIVEDEDENSIIRGTAVSALGKVGNEEDIAVLTAIFEDKDPFLRASALKGLAGFKTNEAKNVLLQGFKDSYYKVRLQAIKSAKEEKWTEAVPYILYRAKKDPEAVVKNAAIEALSELNDPEANTWLIESFTSEKTGISLKCKIAEFLLKNNFGLIYSEFEKEALKVIEDPKKKQICIEFGKIISKIENDLTVSVAQAYLNHKDTVIKSLGLDMFKKNKYSQLIPIVTSIAQDKKSGALGRRAKNILEAAGIQVNNEKAGNSLPAASSN